MTGRGTQTRTTGVTTIALLVLRTGELKIVSLCRVLCYSFFVPYYISFIYQDQWKNSYGESDQCLHCLLHTYFITPPDVFFFFFFFQFLGYLLVHVLNFFFSWNCILRKENIFAYLLPGTFIGWQLQNKLFNKPGLLTGSSGQIFQIKLNYCRSAFFHLSAS